MGSPVGFNPGELVGGLGVGSNDGTSVGSVDEGQTDGSPDGSDDGNDGYAVGSETMLKCITLVLLESSQTGDDSEMSVVKNYVDQMLRACASQNHASLNKLVGLLHGLFQLAQIYDQTVETFDFA